MTFMSRVLLITGSILLAHACYSAQEVSALLNTNDSPISSINSAETSDSTPYPSLSGTSTRSLSNLPLDVIIETLVSVALLCLGIVLGSEPLKPISWRVWAAKVEREKDLKKDVVTGTEDGYLWLENGRRKGFIDIRQHRQDFANWVRTQDQ
ncbi:MAG: hypothetical protein GOMPHAMPRED_004211 [Gomphillus americanus]|uniref:Transmembrane protein 32 protein n=1 Tax=Gomphillus americanus TaxID=1940652 RepID=A0A8H3IU66_9LECA|nr:MAG: hypothetical protein GOMPHAMPRED_004211 [Gomphillus americanus]